MEDPDNPQGLLPQNWGWGKPKLTVPCIGLKAKAKNRSSVQPFVMIHFVGLDLAHANQVVLATITSPPPLEHSI
ncbi:hypothetical protein TNCV_1427701 [Trichonephila clavipes]|nr:hypothetical protein TNCV_1427701 [Trichonephila clavipes]